MKKKLQLLSLFLVLALTGCGDDDSYRSIPVPYVFGEWEMIGYYEGENYIEDTNCLDIMTYSIFSDRTGKGVEVPCNTAYSYYEYYLEHSKLATNTYKIEFSSEYTPPWLPQGREAVVATIVDNKMHIESYSSWNNDNPNHQHHIAVYHKYY